MSSSEKEKKEPKSDTEETKKSSDTSSDSNMGTHTSRLSLAAALSRIIHFGSTSKQETLENSKERESHTLDMGQEKNSIHKDSVDAGSTHKLKQILEQPKEALEEPLSSSSSSEGEGSGDLGLGAKKPLSRTQPSSSLSLTSSSSSPSSSPLPSSFHSSSSSSDRLSVSSSSESNDNDSGFDARLLDHTDILLDGESSSLFDTDSDNAEHEDRKKHAHTTILSSFSVKHKLQLIRKEFSELKSQFNLKEVDVIGGVDDEDEDEDEDEDYGNKNSDTDNSHIDAKIGDVQNSKRHGHGKTPSPEHEPSIAAMLLSLPANDEHGLKANEHRHTTSRISWIVRLDIPYHYPAVRPAIKYVSHKGELLPNLKGLKKAFQERVSLPLASLRDAFIALQQIMETEPVPRITPDPLTKATVLVRDYGYPLLDARYYGKERDYSMGVSELLEYEDEGFSDDPMKRTSGLFDTRSGRRKSRLPKDRAVALYAFQPELEGEMGLAEGDPIYILERPGNGWLLASKCNAPELFGYVPENYVRSTKR